MGVVSGALVKLDQSLQARARQLQNEHLDSSIPVDYLALCLLNLGHDLQRPVQPNGNPVKFTGDDYTAAMGRAFNLHYGLVYIRAIKGCYIETSPNLYERITDDELQDLIMVWWKEHTPLLGSPSPKKIEDSMKMVKHYTDTKLDTINRRYIAVAENLFWDMETATLTDSPEHPVFFRLFDTPKPTPQHYIQVPPFTPEQVSTLRARYQRDLAYLTEHNGDLPEEYDFVRLWADGSHDFYMDLLKASASPFFHVKPLGAFMPSGLRRNGKTAWSNDFMKTMLGVENTTSVRLSQLGDHHLTKQLQWTLYNAPDEEDEGMTKYISDFKTMCDHGRLDKPQLYSTDPIPVDCDFVCVFPMNHTPTWTGDGVAALVKRSLVLPFTHQFDDEDNNPVPFAERTFTAEMFSHMLGTLFAIATYYRSHKLTFSPSMEAQRQVLEEESDSHIQYFEHFIVFFDGISSIKQVYDDYLIWCTAHELEPKSLATFKMAFKTFTVRDRTNATIGGAKYKVQRIKQQGKVPYADKAIYKIGCPEVMHKKDVPLSIVQQLEAELEEKLGDEYEAQLLKMIATAKLAIAHQTVSNAPTPPPPEPPEQPPLIPDADNPFAEGKYE